MSFPTSSPGCSALTVLPVPQPPSLHVSYSTPHISQWARADPPQLASDEAPRPIAHKGVIALPARPSAAVHDLPLPLSADMAPARDRHASQVRRADKLPRADPDPDPTLIADLLFASALQLHEPVLLPRAGYRERCDGLAAVWGQVRRRGVGRGRVQECGIPADPDVKPDACRAVCSIFHASSSIGSEHAHTGSYPWS